MVAGVGERVGRRVDDAHQQRPRPELDHPAAQPQEQRRAHRTKTICRRAARRALPAPVDPHHGDPVPPGRQPHAQRGAARRPRAPAVDEHAVALAAAELLARRPSAPARGGRPRRAGRAASARSAGGRTSPRRPSRRRTTATAVSPMRFEDADSGPAAPRASTAAPPMRPRSGSSRPRTTSPASHATAESSRSDEASTAADTPPVRSSRPAARKRVVAQRRADQPAGGRHADAVADAARAHRHVPARRCRCRGRARTGARTSRRAAGGRSCASRLLLPERHPRVRAVVLDVDLGRVGRAAVARRVLRQRRQRRAVDPAGEHVAEAVRQRSPHTTSALPSAATATFGCPALALRGVDVERRGTAVQVAPAAARRARRRSAPRPRRRRR